MDERRRFSEFPSWIWGADEPRSLRSLVAATPAVWTSLALVVVLSVVDFIALPSDPFGIGRGRLTVHLGASPARIAQGEWWRLITAALTNPADIPRYTGLNHLVWNASGLALAGIRVEYALGRLRFLTIFVLGALFGSVLPIVVFPPRWGLAAGTSTSVFAMFGAVLVIAYVERNRSVDKRRYFVVSWALLGYVVIGGAGNAFDNIAHLGGGVVGVVMTAAWMSQRWSSRRVGAVLTIAFVVVSAALVIANNAQLRESDPRVQRIPIDSRAELVAHAFGSIWAHGDGFVTRIDPRTQRVVARIKTATKPLVSDEGSGSMVPARGSLWVSSDRSVAEIDPDTNKIKSRVPVPGIGPWGLSASDDVLWAALNTEDKVARIDLRTRRVRVTRVGKSPYIVLASDRGVWVANYESRSVSRLDHRTGAVLLTARVDGEPYSMELGRSLLVGMGSSVLSLAPDSLRVNDRFELTDFFYALTLDDTGGLWVSNRFNFSVARVDQRSGKILDRIKVGLGQPAGMTFERDLWVADPEERSILRVQTDGESGL